MRLGLVLVLVLAACGPAPGAEPPSPQGTLVIVIRQGPERVPFHPKVARIARANQQLAGILGHAVAIELDGSLLPQDHDGAEDVLARLVEDVARDVDELAKEDPKALAFARASFERLVVRYAPAEAAARDVRGSRRRGGAKLDAAAKTVDVVRAEGGSLALNRGEVGGSLYDAFTSATKDRYARVLPGTLPRSEHRAWFDYHARSNSVAEDRVGSIDPLRVRGMVILAAGGEVAQDARAWLIHACSDFASTYHHQPAEVESALPRSAYRQAETAYVAWLRAELPRMSVEEKASIAEHLWVTDFRKEGGDRFATYAFPGLDPMAFSLDAVDAWIAAGHPARFLEYVVCPATGETKNGQLRYSRTGHCDGVFYRWALANRAREDVLVSAVLARGDAPFATSVFHAARGALRDEADSLRFLRRFERAPAIWTIGADVEREVVFRPSAQLLEESRRWWREVPFARGHALLWFARHTDGSYHPDSDWPDLLQGAPADPTTLGAYLDLGWDAFEMLPAAWPALARAPGRMRVVTTHAHALATETRSQHTVPGTLVPVAYRLCDERSPELAELRAFAQTELAARPGAGWSDVVDAADASKCPPRRSR